MSAYICVRASLLENDFLTSPFALGSGGGRTAASSLSAASLGGPGPLGGRRGGSGGGGERLLPVGGEGGGLCSADELDDVSAADGTTREVVFVDAIDESRPSLAREILFSDPNRARPSRRFTHLQMSRRTYRCRIASTDVALHLRMSHCVPSTDVRLHSIYRCHVCYKIFVAALCFFRAQGSFDQDAYVLHGCLR